MSASEGQTNNHGIDWTRYSSSYDLMVRYNPYYRENMRLAMDAISSVDLEPGTLVCDIGAGTGNYISALSTIIDEARFTHVDTDSAMNAIAGEKYKRLGLEVSVVTDDVYGPIGEESPFGLVVCVNALYAMPEPRAVLRRIFELLEDGGHFFIIDYGRQMKVLGWAGELIKFAYSQKGFGGVVELFRSAPSLIRQNATGSRMQSRGSYWTHSTREFQATLRQVGFEILSSGICYRGACDFALLRKPS